MPREFRASRQPRAAVELLLQRRDGQRQGQAGQARRPRRHRVSDVVNVFELKQCFGVSAQVHFSACDTLVLLRKFIFQRVTEFALYSCCCLPWLELRFQGRVRVSVLHAHKIKSQHFIRAGSPACRTRWSLVVCLFYRVQRFPAVLQLDRQNEDYSSCRGRTWSCHFPLKSDRSTCLFWSPRVECPACGIAVLTVSVSSAQV